MDGKFDAIGDAVFSLCQALRPHPEELLHTLGVPLPAAEVTVLHHGLPWHCYHVCSHAVLVCPALHVAVGPFCLLPSSRVNVQHLHEVARQGKPHMSPYALAVVRQTAARMCMRSRCTE